MSVAVLAVEALGERLLGVEGVDFGDRSVQGRDMLFKVRGDGLVCQVGGHVGKARPVVDLLWSPPVTVDLLQPCSVYGSGGL